MNNPDLGKKMHFLTLALRGGFSWSEEVWRAFLVDVSRALGMNPIAKAASWEYPIDSHGGTGWTIVQPITESFLALDTWPDHKGAYLVIASCKPINVISLYAEFRRHQLMPMGKCEQTHALV